MTTPRKPIAADIYDRQSMDSEGQGGSVDNDIADMLDEGDFEGLEDYFGDLDPIAFL